MSRLIVKNLPAYLTQQRLRAYFETADGPGGTLTDVKLVLSADGTSRRFGFIGYKTPAEAERAQKWFNKSFVDTSRIAVEVVDGAKDAPPSRPNKRPRIGPAPDEASTSASANAQAKVKAKKGKEAALPPSKSKQANDGQLGEFLHVMQSRSKKGPLWANDEAAHVKGASASDKTASTGKQAASAKLKKESEIDSRQQAQPAKQETADAKADEIPQEDAAISDMDWFKRHTKTALDVPDAAPEKVFEQSDDDAEESGAEDADSQAEKDEPPPDPIKDTILQTSRLFVRNLAFSCTEDELRETFERYGDISQIHIPLDASAKQTKGLAYVTFAKAENALAAYEALDKTSFQGRLLHILPAVDRRGKAEVQEGNKKTLKEEREAKRKAAAGREFNWAMLYMNSDAVVSSIADRMNIPKADILNSESDNAAVKLALAETHIINETKSFLESHGVVLSALSSTKAKRSDTIILVKNIPYGTSADTLRTMFGAHGELHRVLVPPAGTLAVVEYEHASDARTAFRTLAYRRLGNSVMYLEKAPLGMFSEDAAAPSAAGAGPVIASAAAPVKAPLSVDAIVEADEEAKGADADAEPPLAAGTTLFVKNLSFSTTTEGLTTAVRHLPGFAFARVQMKVDPARPSARLSAGYGFVGFKGKEEAKRAMKSLAGYVLDGHVLTVKWAGRGTEETEGQEAKGRAKSAKMIVKNVPFEATKKDIQELFGAHAQLKSVRLPRKFDRRTRGFAFLEFVSPHEAARAYSTLRHTHLLGRHLVLEWAEDGAANIEELRQKAGVGFGGGKTLPGRKRKLQLGDAEGHEDDGL